MNELKVLHGAGVFGILSHIFVLSSCNQLLFDVMIQAVAIELSKQDPFEIDVLFV